jgi:ER membrane protein complex subunit 2
MAPSLLRPQGNLTPAEARKLAAEAPIILGNNPKAFSSSPLQSLFSASESAELWVIYENLLLTCLRTSDDRTAHECLERLILRFGDDNERILALKGLVKEAQANNNKELEDILKDYDAILAENGTNIVSRTEHSARVIYSLFYSQFPSDGLHYYDLWDGKQKQYPPW